MAAKASSKAASKPAKDYYKVSGDSIERTNQFCPRCGEGVFLAEHKDRRSCGKCGYTEFKK